MAEMGRGAGETADVLRDCGGAEVLLPLGAGHRVTRLRSIEVRKVAPFIAAIVGVAWAGAAASTAASSLPRLFRADLSSGFAVRPATMSLGCCGQYVIGGPGVRGAAFRMGKRGRIRWTDWGPVRADGVGWLWIASGAPSCGATTFRPRRVTIEAFSVRRGRYTELRLVYWVGKHRVVDSRWLGREHKTKPWEYQWFGPRTAGGPAPGISAGGTGSLTQNTATLSGAINPNGRPATYYFQYGTTKWYGSSTAGQTVRSGRKPIDVAAGLSGLSPGTRYHYRIYARNAVGATCGGDRTFMTAMTLQQLDASRAVATYNAMQQYFYAPRVYSGDKSSLYAENYPQSGRRYSFLWPFSRVLAGTITLAGVPSALVGGASYQPAVADRLTGLSHYWDSKTSPSGYDSYPTAPYGGGGDKYYDDQAWVGLDAAQNYAMSGDPTSLGDAKNVFNYVYPGGWGGTTTFEPGGIYWVNQGVGVGVSNHDRTTTSNAPNAELALLLEKFDPANAASYDAGASAMYGWVNHYLYNVNTNPTDPNSPNPNYDANQPALMFDKVTGSDAIDETLYTYNQGTMIAANVREYQRTGNAAYLSDAEAIARTALSTFNESYYINHSAAFNAIYFRGLLVLYSAISDSNLQSQIIQTIQHYADDAWKSRRSSNGLFGFTSSSGAGYQLIDQGAMLQIYAMLAWNPGDYGNLP